MPISNIIYLNRIQTSRSRKQLRNRPIKVAIEIEDELNLKEFLQTVKGQSEKQVKLNQY